jgi:hypothetical protein
MWMWRSAIIGTTALCGLALAGGVSADQPVRAAVLDRSDQRVVATAPVPSRTQDPDREAQVRPPDAHDSGRNDGDLGQQGRGRPYRGLDDTYFRSPGLETDEGYSYRFTKPGVYQYFCTLHPLMTGKVIVK